MVLFRPGYLKEGPGIEKDAPPKKGLALFAEILAREFWQLIKLNLLFLICCIPIVTIGPAIGAMTACTLKMTRDVPNDVWYDFRQAFRRHFQTSFVLGAICLIPGALILGAMLGAMLLRNPTLLCAACAAGVFFGLFMVYAFPMAIGVDLPLAAAVKNAWLLGIGCLRHSLPALLLCAALFGLCWWFFPLSLPVVVLLPFAISSFVTSFAAWGDIKRLVIGE